MLRCITGLRLLELRSYTGALSHWARRLQELWEWRAAQEMVISDAVPYKISCCFGNEWERGTWQGLLLESKNVLKSNGKRSSWCEGGQCSVTSVLQQSARSRDEHLPLVTWAAGETKSLEKNLAKICIVLLP